MSFTVQNYEKNKDKSLSKLNEGRDNQSIYTNSGSPVTNGAKLYFKSVYSMLLNVGVLKEKPGSFVGESSYGNFQKQVQVRKKSDSGTDSDDSETSSKKKENELAEEAKNFILNNFKNRQTSVAAMSKFSNPVMSAAENILLKSNQIVKKKNTMYNGVGRRKGMVFLMEKK